MKLYVLSIPLCLFLLALPVTAKAQECPYAKGYCLNESYEPETSDTPVCFQITNITDQGIRGSVETFYFRNDSLRNPSGKTAFSRHTSNLRLYTKDEVRQAKRDFIDGKISKEEMVRTTDTVEACSTGPFYQGKLHLSLRGLIPVFSCWFDPKAARPLYIYNGMRKDGVRQIWADCQVTYPIVDSK